MARRLFLLIFIFLPLWLLAQQGDGRAPQAMQRRDFFEALEQKTTGNIDRATQLFTKILKADPACDAAMYELAGIYLVTAHNNEAEQMIAKALEISKDNKWYWLLYAEIARKANKRSLLPLILQNLVRLEPGNQDYYFDQALALSLAEMPERADSIYAEVQQRFGDSQQLQEARQRLKFLQESPAGKVAFFKEEIRKAPSEVANYLDLAEQYLRNGDHAKCLKVLKLAAKLDPDNVLIALLLSDYYEAVNDHDKAQQQMLVAFSRPDFSIDLKIRILLMSLPKLKDPAIAVRMKELAATLVHTHPHDPKAYAVQGDIFVQLNDAAAAIDSYHKALEYNTSVYLVWIQLLQLEASTAQAELLVKDGLRAIALFPEDPDLYFMTALGFSLKKDYLSAENYVVKALNLNPKKMINDSEMYSLLGNTLNSLKKFDESDVAFENALRINPANVLTLNNFAYYLSQRKQHLEKAEEMARKANELQPDVASLQDTYAWVLFRLKKYEDAKVWIEKAIKVNAGSAVQYEHYGDILYHLGMQNKALEQWKNARDRGLKSEMLDRKINEKRYFE